MRVTFSTLTLPALALGALIMQAAPVFAQAEAPTTGPTASPPTAGPTAAPSSKGLPSATPPVATPPAATSTTPAAPHASHRQSLDARFKAANTTNDGNLTLDQAKAANWSYVTKNFSAMDKGSKGSVTLADIRAFAKARRASRHHSTTAKPTTSAPPAAVNPPPPTP